MNLTRHTFIALMGLFTICLFAALGACLATGTLPPPEIGAPVLGMAALGAPTAISTRDGKTCTLPVLAATKIYAGAIVAVDADGYAVNATDTANLVVRGIADETVDNTEGADGALTIRVRRGAAFLLESDDSPTPGETCYVRDNAGVQSAASATNDIAVGPALEAKDADGNAWVQIG